jgi:ferritin-like metal-binding protein YciE
MPATSLADLYTQKLQLLLDAEHQGLDAIPQLAQAVRDPKLRDALQKHRRESEEHVQRLQQLIDANREGSRNQECTSMRALIQEAQRTLADIQDPDTVDAFVIGAQQAIEHHEIAAYGTARSWAQELGRDDDARTLQRTLDEEGRADEQLSAIAERQVNERASKGADREVGLSRGSEADRSRRDESGRGAGRLTDVEAQRGADLR